MCHTEQPKYVTPLSQVAPFYGKEVRRPIFESALNMDIILIGEIQREERNRRIRKPNSKIFECNMQYRGIHLLNSDCLPYLTPDQVLAARPHT